MNGNRSTPLHFEKFSSGAVGEGNYNTKHVERVGEHENEHLNNQLAVCVYGKYRNILEFLGIIAAGSYITCSLLTCMAWINLYRFHHSQAKTAPPYTVALQPQAKMFLNSLKRRLWTDHESGHCRTNWLVDQRPVASFHYTARPFLSFVSVLE